MQGRLPGHPDGGVHWALRWVLWRCPQLAAWWEVALQTGLGQRLSTVAGQAVLAGCGAGGPAVPFRADWELSWK